MISARVQISPLLQQFLHDINDTLFQSREIMSLHMLTFAKQHIKQPRFCKMTNFDKTMLIAFYICCFVQYKKMKMRIQTMIVKETHCRVVVEIDIIIMMVVVSNNILKYAH